MKNLTQLFHIERSINATSIKHLLEHPEKEIFFFANASEIFRFDNEVQFLFAVPDIVDIDNLVLSNELCIATATGEVITFNLDSMTEEVRTCCDGVLAMKFSPDQALSVFVTRSMNVVTLNYDFDPIAEHPLNDDQFGENEFITVGWGKKETQFHGSEGKEAAKRKEEFQAIENMETVDKTCTITWRGDGEYFAVSFVQKSERGRMFKVFNKEGHLQFTSEPCGGLEPPIFWRPSGLWLAVPQVLPGNKYRITLFEKNGLRHRELSLPFKREEQIVKSLAWNGDSEILLIETQHVANPELNSLYLFTICNYHWYLKQYLQFNIPIATYTWSIANGKLLHILLSDGTLHSIKWELEVNRSWGDKATDEGVVAVIDGPDVLLTNFRGTIIPPPMCGARLTFPNPISQVGFPTRSDCEEEHTNCFFAVDAVTGVVNVCEPKFTCNEKDPISVHRLTCATVLKEYKSSTSISRILWISPRLFVGLQERDLVLLEAVEDRLEVIDVCGLGDTTVAAMQACYNVVCLQNLTGIVQMVKVQSNKKLSKPELLYELPEICDKIEILKSNGQPPKVYAFKYRHNLFCNQNKVASDVTSFHLTDKYVAYTTLTQLHFVKLTDDVDPKQPIESRRMERGAQIVTIVSESSKCVFQLPRGNLEVIHPRLLSIHLIGDLLDAKKYWMAFDLLRKQRINLNLIVDHNPKTFLDDLDEFVRQISNPQWLNLFITDLQNEDVTRTMYADNYDQCQSSVYPNSFDIAGKVHGVCNKLIEVFEKQDKEFELPKITCYVKKGLIENALAFIWTLKKAESNIKAEQALKYLLYLVDVNHLYNVALGMYDFGLVLFVATKSQKDPKEYLPFLNELKKYEEHYQKFKIDVHLKRYVKAIGHISQCGDEKFVEAVELIKSQNLYTTGMKKYEHLPGCYRKICAAYGDYLRVNGKLLDASLMYEKAEDYQQAINTCRNILAWRKCLSLDQKRGCSEVERHDMSVKLLAALQENGRYGDAVELLKFCQPNDHRAIINAALKGKIYREAIFRATFCELEVLDTVIVPHFQSYVSALLEEINEDASSFNRYKSRLETIRKERLMKKTFDNGANDVNDNYDDNCDLYSDTTMGSSTRHTASSKGTGKTFRSSKNRRKHERKLLNLKEGNQFEDIAIIDALHTLILKCSAMQQQNHVKEILEAGIDLNQLKIAEQLQLQFEKLLKMMRDALDEIWLPEMMVADQLETSAAMPVDFLQVQNQQHYAMIKPNQRYKPDLPQFDWKFHILAAN